MDCFDDRGQRVLRSKFIGGLSRGVMPLGPDTYRIHGSRGLPLGGNVGVEKDALEEASRYCVQLDKQFMGIGTYGTGRPGVLANAGGGYQLDFRCLNRGDPGLGRPTSTPAPTSFFKSAARGC
jgi:hypothetical protein